MDINQLSTIVKKKILEHRIIKSVEVEDKSFLHKDHKSNEKGKFHIKLIIKSEELNKKNKIESNKFIFKILNKEMKLHIHSLQILFI
jgi:BolA protein